VNDDELGRMRGEKSALTWSLVYKKMDGYAERKARYDELTALIAVEEKRRAALTGPNLAERQLQDSAEMVAANRRMADASEAAAKASAMAAEASKAAARWTLVAALVAATAVGIQAWQAWRVPPGPAAQIAVEPVRK
jgi:hypothetical protein